MNHFSETLKRLRKDRALTQVEVAKACGVGKSAVCNWEKGIRLPEGETLERLADFFNVDIDYLCGASEKTSMVVMEEETAYEAYTHRAVNTNEIAMLTQYRKLSADEKDLVRGFLKKASSTPEVWEQIKALVKADEKGKN